MYFINFTQDNKRKIQQLKDFLHSIDLKISSDVEEFIIIKEDMEIIASGGISGNVLKCVGISPKYRGKGLMLTLMSQLVDLAHNKGRDELFLFSKYENEELFSSCGFKTIEQIKDEIVLMENSNNLEKYKQKLISQKKDYPKIGSIVLNANPFTLGHRYLVHEASKRCDWLHLFVVKEDASFFSFKDRFELIKKGVEDICNITLHEGSEYIISRATFPTYFLKKSQNIESIYSHLDALIFKNHIAPCLGINYRFLGSEPECVVTCDYNKQIKKTLSSQIQVVEIERKMCDNKPISASTVRAYLKNNELSKIKNLVPKSTYEYLNPNYAIENAK